MNRYEAQVEIAKKKVLDSCVWYTAKQLWLNIDGWADIGDLAWGIDNNLIFGVKYGEEFLYPGYMFFSSKGLIFNPHARKIIRILKEKKDSWGMAFWFAGANGWIDGDSPQSILINKQYDRYDSLIEAAKEEIRGITHG